jgi:hypothetical protein
MALTGPRQVKAAFASLLSAKVSGLTIYTFNPSDDALDRDHVIFGDVSGSIDPNTMGGGVLADYRIDGSFSVTLPNEDDADDRAWTLINALAEVVADDKSWTVSGTVMDADIVEFELNQDRHPNGGARVEAEFAIRVRDLNQ